MTAYEPGPSPPQVADPARVPPAGAAAPADRGTRPPAPWARRLVEWVLIVAIAAGAAFAIKAFVLQAFYIPSPSMYPTLRDGDRILVDKLSYDLHAIHRDDVVVFAKPPLDTGEPRVHDLVKRVVGLPGDTISSAPDGQVLIDGRPLAESYLTPDHVTGSGAGPPITRMVIPPGQYFVMGDNRSDSKDSRYFGTISKSLVVGRVVIRVWPVTSIRLF